MPYFDHPVTSPRQVPKARDSMIELFRLAESADFMIPQARQARLFYGTSDFVDLVCLSIPESDWTEVEFKVPPEESGMIFFGKQVQVSVEGTPLFRAHAVMWAKIQSAVPERFGDSIGFIWFGRADDKPVVLQAARAFPVGQTTLRSGGTKPLGDRDQSLWLLGALVATLIQYPNLVEVDVRKPDAPEVKRARKKRKPAPDPITVIDLRKNVRAGVRDVKGAERTYRSRWIVRGHHRQQACGPGRRERRTVFIAPHVKGPQDAPLVQREKVYRW